MSSERELATEHQAQLHELAQELLGNRTLVLASNRGPVEFLVQPDGSVTGKRGAGGVVTAMSAISRYANPVWVASAMTEGDRRKAQEAGGQHLQWSSGDYNFRLRFVATPRPTYEQYYSTISNPLLWFLQHYMWDPPRTPTISRRIWEAWNQGYVAVNHAFAKAIEEEVKWTRKQPVIMLQDYHLYLCAGDLRPNLPDDALLYHFVHIPWPGPDYWVLLPESMRRAIFRSLCASDILGFQTRSSGLNFIRCCESFLPSAKVKYETGAVTLDGHTVWVRDYAISLDVGRLHELAGSDEVTGYREFLKQYCGEKTIVRIDRAEPSKNIVRGFQAFELLLERYPRYHGRIKFLAFLVPSRLGVDQYKQYLEELSGMASWINANYGSGQWEPVELFMGDNYPRAIAAMQLYDVLLVNPIIDGMNLVSKEGPTVNERDGVLVLSEGAGSFEQLRDGALTVSPYDLVGTAQAMYQGLEMAPAERRRRAQTLRRVIEEQDIAMWLYHQFEDFQRRLEAQP